MRHLLLAGATGLIGRLTLPLLLARAEHAGQTVLAIGRRAPALQHRRLHAMSADLDDPAGDPQIGQAIDRLGPIDAFVCCLGSTMRQAGSEQAFAAVDRGLVARLARLARGAGARQALIVSSVGADAGASNFYLRIKGQAEQAVRDAGFERCDFLRPGLLIGPRGTDRRAGERIAQRLAPLTDRLLHGRLRRFRSIPAATVAAALADLTGRHEPGVHVHGNDALRGIARAAQ